MSQNCSLFLVFKITVNIIEVHVVLLSGEIPEIIFFNLLLLTEFLITQGRLWTEHEGKFEDSKEVVRNHN